MNREFSKNLGLAILRIVVSVLFMTHGFPKFIKLLSGDFKFADPIGVGALPSLILVVIAEFICPILLIIGYKTRLSAIPPVITMLVAAFIVHGADAINKKESAIIYLTVFVVLALTGPGKFSVDKR